MSESNSPTSIFNTEKCPADQLLWTIKERISRAHTIENILSPISSRDEYIFRTNPNVDDDDASQISELSDPFQELGGNIISNAENNQKRRLSKLEADVLVMNSFPSAHMQIQASLIESGSFENSFFSPDIHVEIVAGADASFDDSESDVEFFQQISTTMDQVGIKSYKEDKKKNEDREKQRQKLKSKKSLDDQDIDSSSLLSGIWRMLDAASMDEDGFPITQPGYNFFNDREKKLFVRPLEKTWTQKEEVRKKCEEWLKNVNK